MKKRYFPIAAMGALALLVSGTALAAPSARNAHAEDSSTRASASPSESEGHGKGKLVEAKVKVCKVKEGLITRRSSHLEDRAATIETKFADIATKVDTYYTTKLVPAGKTLSTYDALKADIATKKAAVDAAVSAAKADLTSFSCTGDDPKGAMTSFRTDMQAVNQALKDYRGAIKNFTQALHQLVGDTASPSASETPEASE